VTSVAAQVLLAEDSPADAEFVLEALAEHRASGSIYVAPDGVDALDFLFGRGAHAERGAEAGLRLVLLDIKLPKVSGLEVLREIKRDARLRSVPVVMLTSSALEADVSRAYQLGANSYVQKPVDFLEFRETVRAVGRYWLSLNESAPAPAALGEPR
jgi:two-component system response regulator